MTQAMLTAEQTRDGIKRFSHWNYRWDFGHGMTTAPNDPDQVIQDLRLRRIFDPLCAHFKRKPQPLSGLSVIDIGCNEGTFSIEAKRLGADRVLGIEPRKEKVEQAQFVARALGVDGIEYRAMSLWDLSKETVGTFDIVLYTGVLHHVDRPIESLMTLRPITAQVMVIDTMLVGLDYPVITLKEEGVEIVTNAFDSSLILLVSAKALRMMLPYAGFGNTITLPKPTEKEWKKSKLGKRYLRGSQGTFLTFPIPVTESLQKRTHIRRTGHEALHGDLFLSMLRPSFIATNARLAFATWLRALPGKIYRKRWIAKVADSSGLTGIARKMYSRVFR